MVVLYEKQISSLIRGPVVDSSSAVDRIPTPLPYHTIPHYSLFTIRKSTTLIYISPVPVLNEMERSQGFSIRAISEVKKEIREIPHIMSAFRWDSDVCAGGGGGGGLYILGRASGLFLDGSWGVRSWVFFFFFGRYIKRDVLIILG